MRQASSTETSNQADDQFWYLVQLKPGGLARAVLNLRRQGFQTFMPMRETSIRRRGKIAPALRALFPGYLFTQVFPDKQDWRSINGTFGVLRLVALSGARPTRVPSELISALRARTDEHGLLHAPELLNPGDTVRIISGPFAKCVAEIETVEPHDRIVLLLDLMGRSVRTEASARQVENL